MRVPEVILNNAGSLSSASNNVMPVVATSTYETPLIGLPETFDIKLFTSTNGTIFLIFVLSSINILFCINLPIKRLLISGTGKYPKLSAPKFC